jgi:zinc and cadmium transporter
MEAILSSIFVSCIALVGLFTFSIKKDVIEKISFALVAVAAGTFLGDAFFHLLPESIELAGISNLKEILIFPVFGILTFFVLEEVIHWHHHLTEEVDIIGKEVKKHIHPMAITNLVGDGLHNFLDGVAIAASFSISSQLGVATVLAIVLHEIPQEFADFGILTYSGLKRKSALIWNFISGLLSVLGVIVFQLFASSFDNIEKYILATIAGVFIYIATTDLFPEIHRNKRVDYLQIFYVIAGILIMYSLTVIE